MTNNVTLGESIWAESLTEWYRRDHLTLIALGKIVIAAIDSSWKDLENDHAAEIAAMEEKWNTT